MGKGAAAKAKTLLAVALCVRALLVVLMVPLVVAGCFSQEVDPASIEEEVRTDDASLRDVEETFQGSATATPAEPGAWEFPFEVPSGAIGVNATLTWDPAPGTRLRLELFDARGESAGRGWQEADGRVSLATVDPPKPGTWTFVVTTSLALDVPFEIAARAQLLVPEHNVVRDTVDLGPASFYEINLIMEADASFNFTFESSAPVAWDIHSHPEGGVKYWKEGEGTSANETFTAPKRGVYSVLFENLNPSNVDVRYEVVGAFRLHSHGG